MTVNRTGPVLQLAALFDLIGLTWLLTYSAMLGAVGAALDRPVPRRLMRWLTGTVLVGLGARVALERPWALASHCRDPLLGGRSRHGV